MERVFRRYVVVFAVLVSLVDQGTALSTGYGNTNKNKENDKPVPPASSVRGRECKTDTDCYGVSGTFCITDPRDHKTRCLCVNRSAPNNGQCPKIPKALKSVCSFDHDCLDGALCSPPVNSTSSSATKTCMCKEGYFEEEHMCNSGFTTSIPSLASLLIVFSFLATVVSV